MVKRHPHTAIIFVEAEAEWRDGEYIAGEAKQFTIKGQYYPSNSGNQEKRNSMGNEFIVRGEFSTRVKKIQKALRIVIEEIGLDSKIECWEQFQTHSIIYI